MTRLFLWGITMIEHHKSELGKFNYDTEEYEIIRDFYGLHLRYIGNGNRVHFPQGCNSCRNIFEDYQGKYLDLSEFDTTDVIDMSNMFRGCFNVETLDLSNFNTVKVKTMESMFNGCTSLKQIDLTNFNVENVICISYMFKKCVSLEVLDLTSFRLNSVAYKEIGVFKHCKRLRCVVLPSKYAKDTNDFIFSLLSDCISLRYIQNKDMTVDEQIFERIDWEDLYHI